MTFTPKLAIQDQVVPSGTYLAQPKLIKRSASQEAVTRTHSSHLEQLSSTRRLAKPSLTRDVALPSPLPDDPFVIRDVQFDQGLHDHQLQLSGQFVLEG